MNVNVKPILSYVLKYISFQGEKCDGDEFISCCDIIFHHPPNPNHFKMPTIPMIVYANYNSLTILKH